MWKTAHLSQVTLGKIKIVALINHGTDNFGSFFDFVNVPSNFGIGFADVVLVIVPGSHIHSPLFVTCLPVVSFSESLFDLTLWSFLGFLAELVKKHECFILKVEIENPIVARTKFPDIFNEMFGYICPEPCSIFLQKFNVKGNLLVLDAGIFALNCFLLEIVKKFPEL